MDIIFTDREADVMQVLWDHGACLVAEVQEKLHDPLAYTTVLTVLRTLESKQYVGHEAAGRGHRYHALIEPVQARKSALQHLTAKLFKGSSDLLMTHFVTEQNLSATQADKLRALLAAHDDAAAKDQP
jgi:BlaI family penicillinase repressor